MRKIILILGLFFMINTTATAEVYHGIDIDDKGKIVGLFWYDKDYFK